MASRTVAFRGSMNTRLRLSMGTAPTDGCPAASLSRRTDLGMMASDEGSNVELSGRSDGRITSWTVNLAEGDEYRSGDPDPPVPTVKCGLYRGEADCCFACGDAGAGASSRACTPGASSLMDGRPSCGPTGSAAA